MLAQEVADLTAAAPGFLRIEMFVDHGIFQNPVHIGAGLGKAIAVGAVSGLVSSAVGGIPMGEASTGKAWFSAITAASAGTASGTGMSVAMGGSFDATDFAISLGSSLAGVVANNGIAAAQGASGRPSPVHEDVDAGESLGGEAGGPGLKAFQLASEVVKSGGTLAKWAAKNYPKIKHPVTGKLIAFPKGTLAVTPGRVAGKYRDAYIKAYEAVHGKMGKAFWDGVEIHHIRPLNHGGTNQLSNLVHLTPSEHAQFTRFWANYKYIMTKGVLGLVGEAALEMAIPKQVPMPTIIFIAPEVLERYGLGEGPPAI